MLRASGQNNNCDVDIQSVNGDISAAQSVKYGEELLTFTEAVANRSAADLSISRAALLAAAGPEVLVDAAGVAANFQRMVRIADSMGIPVDNMDTELGQSVRNDLALERFASAQNTLAASNR